MEDYLYDYCKEIQSGTQKNYYIIENYEPVSCPYCGSDVERKGNKKRKVISEDGTINLFSLKRYYCDRCNTLHLEIPDLIIPYKQYERNVIEKVKSGDCGMFVGDNRTIHRWRRNI